MVDYLKTRPDYDYWEGRLELIGMGMEAPDYLKVYQGKYALLDITSRTLKGTKGVFVNTDSGRCEVWLILSYFTLKINAINLHLVATKQLLRW